MLLYLSKHILIFPLFSISVTAICKAVPGSADWPSVEAWAGLNETLEGQLIKPNPPGAVCHPEQLTYNATICSMVTTEWSTFPFHRDNPVSSAWNNANNDTCVPNAVYTCSTIGYPEYVVNATTAEHVAAGVKFARSQNVRLIVKGTGHDYLGRSSAPYSLSIWTRNLQGIAFTDSFQPTGCNYTTGTSALTTGAGHVMVELYAAADAKGLTLVGGMDETVGIGGYLTGGGHSMLSVTNGMAADNLLELSLVTPSGDIVTANECQNTDYFYAFRGGGGGTFGVMLNATVKTIPTPAINAVVLAITSPTESTDDYWDAMTYIMTQYPTLSNNSVSGYPYIYPAYLYSNTTTIALYEARFYDHLSAYNDTSRISSLLEPIISHVIMTWPSLTVTNSTNSSATWYQDFKLYHDTETAGEDVLLGSRLLGVDALTGNSTALKAALMGFASGGGGYSPVTPFLLGGRGIADAQPRGGSDAVNPAWRKAITHIVTELTWTPQNETAKMQSQALMAEKVQFLRDLDPDSGAYVNEADPNEPDWQTTFWGSNYDKLRDIKRSVDPDDVFWCHPCVGNERWKQEGDLLCTI